MYNYYFLFETFDLHALLFFISITYITTDIKYVTFYIIYTNKFWTFIYIYIYIYIYLRMKKHIKNLDEYLSKPLPRLKL